MEFRLEFQQKFLKIIIFTKVEGVESENTFKYCYVLPSAVILVDHQFIQTKLIEWKNQVALFDKVIAIY